MDQAKAVGISLIDESKPEESQKVRGHLEALTMQFSKLETAAQTRMTRLEGALQCATVYEDEGSKFCKWLVEAEEKLASMDPYTIASQPLKQQLDDIKVGDVLVIVSHYGRPYHNVVFICMICIHNLFV